RRQNLHGAPREEAPQRRHRSILDHRPRIRMKQTRAAYEKEEIDADESGFREKVNGGDALARHQPAVVPDDQENCDAAKTVEHFPTAAGCSSNHVPGVPTSARALSRASGWLPVRRSSFR